MIVADEGKIHKIVQWTRNGDSQSALLDIFDVTPGEPIQVHATNKLRFNTRFSRVDVIKIAAEISTLMTKIFSSAAPASTRYFHYDDSKIVEQVISR